MTTIHFIRHGQSTWNAETRIQGSSNPDLSDLGVTQAKALHGTLPAFDRVYSSDLARTRQTTEHILKGNTADVTYSEKLREIHLGPWEGVLLADAMESHPTETDHFRNHPQKFNLEGAETFAQLQTRARTAINEIRQQCGAADEVLIVSHGAFIKSLLIEYAGWPISDLWRLPHIDNCGHSIVRYDEDQADLIQLADSTEW